jgi:glutaconate CoA-transferase subunit B
MFDFDPTTRRMRLEALHPGAEVEEVQENTGFEMLIPDEIGHTDPPTEEELRILRELDPDQRYTRAKEE